MAVRIGVIGTGFGQRVVAHVFSETPGCEVVEVISARDDPGVANLCDRADLDLVSIHSPPYLHASHVRRALVAGHAVLCDKPFGVGATEAETLFAAAEAAECLHLVNFEFRCDPIREQLRNLVLDGVIGTPEHVSWTHVSAGSRVPLRPYGWLFDRELGGGWLGAWGSHAIDTIRWIFGDVTSAQGVCRTTITERPGADGRTYGCDADDGFSASLVTTSGVSVAIDSTFAAVAPVAPRLVVTGAAGVLECVADRRILVRHADGARDEHDLQASDADPHLVPMRRWAVRVRDAVEEGVAPSGTPTFADGLACSAVLDAIRGPAWLAAAGFDPTRGTLSG